MPDSVRITIGLLIPLIAVAFMLWRHQKQTQGLKLELANLQIQVPEASLARLQENWDARQQG